MYRVDNETLADEILYIAYSIQFDYIIYLPNN